MSNLLNFFVIDFPEAIVILVTALTMINYPTQLFIKRILLTAFLFSSVVWWLTIIGLTYEYKILLLLIYINILIYFILLRSLWETVIVSISSFSLLLLSEFVVINLFSVFDISLEQIIQNQTYLYVGVWLYLLMMIVAVLIMKKNNFDLSKILPKTKASQLLSLLIGAGTFEFLLIFILSTRLYLSKYNTASILTIENVPFIMWLILLLFLLIMLLFRSYLKVTVVQVTADTEKPYIQNMKELLLSIQQFRHDFNNHFEVVDGFIDEGMIDKAKQYIGEILKDTKRIVQPIEGIKDPAVQLLLQSKAAVCQANNIDFTVKVRTSLPVPNMTSRDLVAVMGNLIDNAIRACLKVPPHKRFINISRYEDDTYSIIIVENSSEIISPDELNKVFELGYTTKEKGNGGHGLHIVKKSVDRCNGTIQVSSINGITKFTIQIPK